MKKYFRLISLLIVLLLSFGLAAGCSNSVSAVSVTGLTLNASTATLNIGDTKQLTATVSPENAENKAVTWLSDKTAVATVSNTGLITAIAAGTATITAKTVDGGYEAVCAIAVSAPPIAVTGISLDKTSASVVAGSTVQLAATVAPENAANKTVSWTTSDSAKATVNAAGLVTGVAAGTATITATTADGSFTATCDITITATLVAVTGVTLNQPTASVAEGGTVQLTATVAPSNATYKAVTFTSNSANATVNNLGLVTGVTAGSATITVTTTDGSFTATCVVTVSPTLVTGVTLNKAEDSVVAGNTVQLTATVAPSNATNKTVNWSTSDSDKATVSGTGLVTAVAVGSATITATTADGGFTATCQITILPVSVTGVTLDKPTASVVAGSTVQLAATVSPANATNKTVNWTTSDSDKATVSSTGLVTGVAAGSATITATTVDGNFKATCAVTITSGNVAVTSVTLNTATASVVEGDTVQLVATVSPANATNSGVSYDTSDSLIATVDSTGLVTGVAAGSAIITVTTDDGDFTDTCIVTVTEKPNVAKVSTEIELNAALANGAKDTIYITAANSSLTLESTLTIGKNVTIYGTVKLADLVIQDTFTLTIFGNIEGSSDDLDISGSGTIGMQSGSGEGTMIYGKNVSITDTTVTINSIVTENDLVGISAIYATGTLTIDNADVTTYSNIYATGMILIRNGANITLNGISIQEYKDGITTTERNKIGNGLQSDSNIKIEGKTTVVSILYSSNFQAGSAAIAINGSATGKTIELWQGVILVSKAEGCEFYYEYGVYTSNSSNTAGIYFDVDFGAQVTFNVNKVGVGFGKANHKFYIDNKPDGGIVPDPATKLTINTVLTSGAAIREGGSAPDHSEYVVFNAGVLAVTP